MATNDVKTLFRRFGGDAGAYQEIVSRDQVSQAEEKWPMLGQIKPTTPHEAPSARRVAPTLTRRLQEDTAAASSTTMPSTPDKAEKVLGLPIAASMPFVRPPTDTSPHAGRASSPSSAFLGFKKTSPEEKSLGGAFQSMLPPHRAAPQPPDAIERLAARAPAPVSSTNTSSAGHNMFSAFLDRGTGGQSGQGGVKVSKTVGASFLGASPSRGGSTTVPTALPKQLVNMEADTALGRKLSGLGGVGNPVERILTVAPTPLTTSQKINSDLQQSFGKLVPPKPNPPLNAPKEVVPNKRLTKW